MYLIETMIIVICTIGNIKRAQFIIYYISLTPFIFTSVIWMRAVLESLHHTKCGL